MSSLHLSTQGRKNFRVRTSWCQIYAFRILMLPSHLRSPGLPCQPKKKSIPKSRVDGAGRSSRHVVHVKGRVVKYVAMSVCWSTAGLCNGCSPNTIVVVMCLRVIRCRRQTSRDVLFPPAVTDGDARMNHMHLLSYPQYLHR